MKTLCRLPSAVFQNPARRGMQAAVAAVAFSLALGMPLPLAAQTPDVPQSQPELEKPKTHAQTHAEAHAQAVAKARALDPVQTPKGRYTREVEGLIGKLWHQYSSFRRDAEPGRVEISFYVTKKGKVEGLVIQDARQSNVVLTDFSLRAVRDAKLPPMPADVYPDLPEADPERLRFDFNFMIAPPNPEEKAKPKPKQPAEKDMSKKDTPKTTATPTTPTAQMPDMAPGGETWQQWLAEQKPLKQYHSQVGDLLSAEWKRYLAAHRATLPGGEVRMSFRVKPDGGVTDVLIVDKEAPIRLKNAGLATLQSVRFPPMSSQQAALFAGKPAALQGVRVPCTFSVADPE